MNFHVIEDRRSCFTDEETKLNVVNDAPPPEVINVSRQAGAVEVSRAFHPTTREVVYCLHADPRNYESSGRL